MLSNGVTTLDMPSFSFGDEANAWPAILINLSSIFHAVEIGWDILSFLFGSFLTDGVGLVDIINAENFEIMRTVIGGEESRCESN